MRMLTKNISYPISLASIHLSASPLKHSALVFHHGMLGSSRNLRSLIKSSRILAYTDVFLIDARNHGIDPCTICRLVPAWRLAPCRWSCNWSQNVCLINQSEEQWTVLKGDIDGSFNGRPCSHVVHENVPRTTNLCVKSYHCGYSLWSDAFERVMESIRWTKYVRKCK